MNGKQNHRKDLQIKENAQKAKRLEKREIKEGPTASTSCIERAYVSLGGFCRFICQPGAVNKPFFPINKKSKKLLNSIESTITQF